MKKTIILCGLWVCIAVTAAAQVAKGGTLYAAAKSVT
jgi:hypothetical protein